ncbi:MAG: Hsp20/alpha crystallin family protein [Oricola sp.]|nr:MAG: Hsp20/alpha crystallin family protein [Oricola sp.]
MRRGHPYGKPVANPNPVLIANRPGGEPMIEKTDTAPEKTDGDEARAVTERSSAPLWTLREEIDDLFEDFFAGNRFGPFRGRRFGWPRQRAGSGFSWGMPTVDVIDKQDAVKICAELPGMAEDDIDVHVTDSALVLSGEKKEEREEGDKEGERYLAERRYGSFSRTIAIPEGIDHDKIEAKFKNGVLTVHLPKKPEAQKPSKKIKVRADA